MTWLRTARARRALDALLIGAVLVTGVAGHVAARSHPDVEAAPAGVLVLVLAAAAAATLWWRRERPLVCLGALLVFVAIAAAADDPGLFSAQVGAELMILGFAVGAWSRHLRRAVGSVAALLVVIVAGATGDNGFWAAAAFGLVLVGLPVMAGYAARVRRQYVEEVERRLAAAEHDRDEQARRAILEERARIARELHDVVAHHVSLIGVQAGAARHALDRAPDQARAALSAIEDSSRDAVIEMHRLLEVLRTDGTDPADERHPQPGLDALGDLFDQWRSAGLAVTARISGPVAAVPATLALSCYRVIEESLTNVARHSMAGAADVAVEVRPEAVEVRVVDPGPGRLPPPNGRSGRGLAGMAERVAMFDGRFAAGPTPERGFAVTARFPRSPGS